MAQVLELKDGGILVPETIFDVFDAVEESMGTDVRDYLEEWFQTDGGEPETGDEAVRDHYRTVLETLEFELGRFPAQKKQEQQFTLERVVGLIGREVHGKEDI